MLWKPLGIWESMQLNHASKWREGKLGWKGSENVSILGLMTIGRWKHGSSCNASIGWKIYSVSLSLVASLC